eukprot:tig00021319_g20220.t1
MTLADFKIIKFIGKGSYGSVYKVLRKSDEKEYAMKEVNIKPMSQKEREEAVNEIRLLASVANPFVIGYYEAFSEGDKIFIVTEYAENGDLGRKIKRCKAKNEYFDENLIWSYFLQLCSGLKALHNLNILHRDMKAQNIFLMSNDMIKIGDLGVAKLLKEGNAQTQVGTPYYMSPEIWKNRPYDKKSDIWSLGCLLYELITYRHPFESNSWKGLANKVLKGQYQEIPGHYSAELRDMVRCLLVTDPLRRPAVNEILQMPAVQRRMHLLPIPDGYVGVPVDRSNSSLLDTIKVPRNLDKLRSRLPASNYPSLPSTPDERREAGLPPINEALGPISGRQPSRGDLRAMAREKFERERERDRVERERERERERDRAEREREERERAASERERERESRRPPRPSNGGYAPPPQQAASEEQRRQEAYARLVPDSRGSNYYPYAPAPYPGSQAAYMADRENVRRDMNRGGQYLPPGQDAAGPPSKGLLPVIQSSPARLQLQPPGGAQGSGLPPIGVPGSNRQNPYAAPMPMPVSKVYSDNGMFEVQQVPQSAQRPYIYVPRSRYDAGRKPWRAY